MTSNRQMARRKDLDEIQKFVNNSLANTRKLIAMKESLYVIKAHVDLLHKTSALISSLNISLNSNGYKMGRLPIFEL